MIVRPIAAATDAPALRRLWRATWLDTYGPLLGSSRLHLVDEAVDGPGILSMFAEDGGGLVGLVSGEVVGSVCYAQRGTTGFVWGMYVHPAHQRRGFGSTLLRAAARAMPAADTVDLSTPTVAAVDFYRGLGFRETGVGETELFPGVVRPSTWLRIAAPDLRREPPRRRHLVTSTS